MNHYCYHCGTYLGAWYEGEWYVTSTTVGYLCDQCFDNAWAAHRNKARPAKKETKE